MSPEAFSGPLPFASRRHAIIRPLRRLKLNHYQKLSLLWLLVGSVLFAFLVYRTGIHTIVSKLELFGAYFLVLLLISGARQVLRTFAWRYCIEREHRHVGLLELFKLRLVGDAITDLTFAGPVLGETAKTYATGAHMPLTFSLSSIVIENLLYSLAVILFIISGAFVLLGRIAVPHQIRTATVAGISIAGANNAEIGNRRAPKSHSGPASIAGDCRANSA